ncbi:hypothetical protein BO70DRAFT_391804 [Aspergillus heteromorphus CBS 117.55]|uniref:Uncharacterized protein n=1 Tax=Aspergillus heteromorphus CBS 117.55 TaxID=1448321 RepID=A0A317X171_9EURO|nr:uncharacterized protein BO70DRAFT_391804 [Aspergillus heteromorphus CBS 117.55]PWY92394.1 hypothetical protein BO70DRAFT_391804 [Aspergillus heteromorphus CBS 117.55]
MSEAVKGLGREARARQGRERAGWFGRLNPPRQRLHPLDKDFIRDVFYNGCDPADIDEATDLLGSFPPALMNVPVTCTAYREIVCENDWALPCSVQERMIAQGGGVFHVERCQEANAPYLSNTRFVVECVKRAAGEDV